MFVFIVKFLIIYKFDILLHECIYFYNIFCIFYVYKKRTMQSLLSGGSLFLMF